MRIKTTLITSGNENYSQNKWEWTQHLKRVKLWTSSHCLLVTEQFDHFKTTLKTSGNENYTQNEREWKLHSKRVKLRFSSHCLFSRGSLITLKLHSNSKRVRLKTTLKTNNNENYTQNEWDWKLHSKRVRMKTTLKMSETTDLLALPFCHGAVWSLENYTQNEWDWKLHLNEWDWKLHSKRVKLRTSKHCVTVPEQFVYLKTTLKTSENENYTQNEWNYGPPCTTFLSRNS